MLVGIPFKSVDSPDDVPTSISSALRNKQPGSGRLPAKHAKNAKWEWIEDVEASVFCSAAFELIACFPASQILARFDRVPTLRRHLTLEHEPSIVFRHSSNPWTNNKLHGIAPSDAQDHLAALVETGHSIHAGLLRF
ncbi:MAG: hypothetical protein HY299_07205 [Verrucomicrobia bacterium]|nr:hypothetical protein [Verrucomicrobiota bacterium]